MHDVHVEKKACMQTLNSFREVDVVPPMLDTGSFDLPNSALALNNLYVRTGLNREADRYVSKHSNFTVS